MTPEAQPAILNGEAIHQEFPLTVFLEDKRAKSVDIVGGKAASLAELGTIPGIKVPEAFVITTSLSAEILVQNPDIKAGIEGLDEMSARWLKATLTEDNEGAEALEKQITAAGDALKKKMGIAKIPDSAQRQIEEEYDQLCKRVGKENVAVAVRSSGISEDSRDNSFAGQYDSFLHQQGKEEVLDAIKKCLASQFTDRAIEYRNGGRLKISQEELADNKDIDTAIKASERLSHAESKLAVIVQEMVNASSAGVGFSVDSKSGAPFIHIDINYGLGESVVSGSVSPDSYDIDPETGAIVGRNLGGKEVRTSYVRRGTEEVKVAEQDRNRFVLTDEQAKKLAGKIAAIREVYGREVDTEFAIDSQGEIYFLQARPETIASNKDDRIVEMRRKIVPEEVAEKEEPIFKGGITGCPGVATGIVVVANTMDEAKMVIEARENRNRKIILVTERTDPDWVSLMRDLGGIVTRVGGATCHAAIVSRELELPCIVGAGDTTELAKHKGQLITLDANERRIYKGELSLKEVGEDIDVAELLGSPTKTPIGLIISNPDMARKMHALSELGPNFMISLLRIEFLLEDIGVHVNALVDFDKGKISPDSDLFKRIAEKIAGYGSGEEYFKTKLTEGIAAFAALFPNSPITLRTTDFKTNEYGSLIGGNEYESEEANPMMGWRGLVRSLSPENREAFKWELKAIKKAREMGYKNIKLMFPVVRDPKELTGDPELDAIGFKGAFEIMQEVGMGKGVDGLKVGIMVEVPTNAVRIRDFIDAGIDFVSFGTNDLTQFTLAADRDNEKIQSLSWYGETNPAVVSLVKEVIRVCKERGIETGICGQAPSNKPEFAKMLIEEGIGSIGVMPDMFLPTHRLTGEVEQSRKVQATSTPTRVEFMNR
ncbi:MAG: hypothetical protein HYW62_00645 [Candidatus Levybacteria bacterium]|nr:hypothetical protein [Candidatus Levybacteria bacterium]